MDADACRDLFPITRAFTFLNHAAVAPPSDRVVQTVRSLLEETSVCGIQCYSKWMRRIEEVRARFADLINADPGEVAFVGNTSEGLSAVATGLTWKSGEAVLVPRPDFPSNVYPWMNLERQGVRVAFYERREGRFEVADVEKALVSGTKLLTVSSVDFVTGFACSLEALGDFCRRKGILFCVDAIQSLGVLSMDVKNFGIHFLASGGHKWLLSTMGIGGLFIAREVNDLVHPLRVGWKSVADEDDYYRLQLDLKPDARRFESGTMNLLGITALGAALELLGEVSIEACRSGIFALNDRFRLELEERKLRVATSRVDAERSGIISFQPSSDSQSLFRFLLDRKIMVSLRGGLIRLSPHFYNNLQDVEAFFQALDEHDGRA